MHRLLLAMFLLFCSVPAFAAPESISRRDGFIQIWASIRRPVAPAKIPFADIPRDSEGADILAYAASRKILDAQEKFYPNDPLTIDQALLWIFRTRNIDLDDLYPTATPSDPDGGDPYAVAFIARKMGLRQYIHETQEYSVQKTPITADELTAMMRSVDTLLATEEHEASMYGEKFHGQGTAFGEAFDMYALTAAHRTLPHNTLVRVTNIANKKSVIVRINDRGPFVDGRDMDLSVAAFTAIEDRSKGILRARFERLGDATLIAGCSDHAPRQVRITRDTRLIGGVPHRLALGEGLVLRSTRPFVIRSISYPDGNTMDTQDWVLPEESFTFTPSLAGTYTFVLGSKEGRARQMTMVVMDCRG